MRKDEIISEQKRLADEVDYLVTKTLETVDWDECRVLYDEMKACAKRIAELDTELKEILYKELMMKRKELLKRLFKITG